MAEIQAEELRIEAGSMAVMGRCKPLPDVEAYYGGLRVRIDFAEDPERWVDLFIPWTEIARAKDAMEKWVKQYPAPSMRPPPK